MKNTQRPEKASLQEDGSMYVHSVFKTIQGEGPFAGQRAIFVRLAGCNLQCPLCDTDYTSHSVSMTPEELLRAVTRFIDNDETTVKIDPRTETVCDLPYLVVITGGEPFRQNLRPFVELLLDHNFGVQLETNGTGYQDLPYEDIVVVCSPKTGSVNSLLKPYIFAYKYVLSADSVSAVDGLPLTALEHPCGGPLARPDADFEGMILVQPADEYNEEKNQRNRQAVVQSVLQYGYTLQLQLHKLVGVE